MKTVHIATPMLILIAIGVNISGCTRENSVISGYRPIKIIADNTWAFSDLNEKNNYRREMQNYDGNGAFFRVIFFSIGLKPKPPPVFKIQNESKISFAGENGELLIAPIKIGENIYSVPCQDHLENPIYLNNNGDKLKIGSVTPDAGGARQVIILKGKEILTYSEPFP